MKIRDGFRGERFIVLPLPVVEAMEKDPLTRELFVFAIGHFPKADRHYVSRSAGCDEYILLYCVDGRGVVTIEGTRHVLLSAQALVIPKGASHAYQSDERHPWTIYWVHFRGHLAARMAEGLARPLTIDSGDTSRREERNRLFDELYDILDHAATMDEYAFSSVLLCHYLATFRYLREYRLFGDVHVPGKSVTRSTSIVRKAIHYMNDNIERHMSLDMLSRFCGYSGSYLFRKFKEETGMAPMVWFMRRKINHACFLLRHTDMTVSQISMKLAFSESQFFARTFKKVMGISATEYRRRGTDGLPPVEFQTKEAGGLSPPPPKKRHDKLPFPETNPPPFFAHARFYRIFETG